MQGKNFDATASLGPWLVPVEGEKTIGDIRLTARVNGELRQDDRTSRMMFGFRYLLNYISTLLRFSPATSSSAAHPPAQARGSTLHAI